MEHCCRKVNSLKINSRLENLVINRYQLPYDDYRKSIKSNFILLMDCWPLKANVLLPFFSQSEAKHHGFVNSRFPVRGAFCMPWF